MFVSEGKRYLNRAEFEKQREWRAQPKEEELPFELRAQDLKRALERPHEPPSLVSRLRTRLGLGDQPERRMKLYHRLQQLWEAQPSKVEQAVAEVWAAAVTSAKKPDRYFCVAIIRRLGELGVISVETGGQYEPI